MYCVRNVTDDLYWVGANDHRLNLFENIHPIPRGVSYNAYLLLDEKTALFDTVDWSGCRQLLENIGHLLAGRELDYLIINHMEPDHGASLEEVLLRYPNVKIISTPKAFTMMEQFGFATDGHEQIPVKEGDRQCFGKHTVSFLMAPMVHWPETMVTFDETNGALFSADAFGTFGALDGKLFNDEVDFDRDWIDDARRYYTNIVGKYGMPVQTLLKKASKLDIRMLCPLHGPVWRSDISYFLEKYDRWSRYEPEEKGVLIAYASMYGNTEAAAQLLATKLCEKGMTNVALYDVSTTHVSYLIADAFKLSHIVLASVTYNLEIYPVMQAFLTDMKGLGLTKRTVAVMENGTWACTSGKLMAGFMTEQMKGMTLLEEKLTLTSSMKPGQEGQLDALAEALLASMERK